MKAKFVLAGLLVAASANAAFWDGNKLLAALNDDTYFRKGMALGYIMGVSDTLEGINHCPATNVTSGQMQDIVRNYLTNIPAQRHQSADYLILKALEIAFPCANNSRPKGGKQL